MAKKFRLNVRLVKRKARRRRNPGINPLILAGGAGLIGLYAYSQRPKATNTGVVPPDKTGGGPGAGTQGNAPTTGAQPVPTNIADLMNAAYNAAGRPAAESAWVTIMQGVYFMPPSNWQWVYQQSITYHNETGGWASSTVVYQWVVEASKMGN